MLSFIRVARTIHMVSAFWAIGLALLIFIDVMGRALFSSPLPGTKEIIQNSVVSIAFLQLPLAIYSGSMLRTTIFSDALPPLGRKILRSLTAILGAAVFFGIMKSTYPSFLDAYRIGEYEGEGSLRVATWPVRGIVLVMCVFSLWAYVSMLILDWQGRLVDENEAPGALPPADA